MAHIIRRKAYDRHFAVAEAVRQSMSLGVFQRTLSQFPAKWLKSSDLTSVKGVSFDGMSDSQKAVALQVLNERHCECGCNMDSIAECAKKDSSCPYRNQIKLSMHLHVPPSIAIPIQLLPGLVQSW